MRAKLAVIALAAAAAGLVLGGTGSGAPQLAGQAAGARTVNVVLKEWTLTPSATRVAAGKVTFVVRNTGKIEHELVVLRSGRHHHQLPMQGAEARETGLRGELEGVAPGQTKRLTLSLTAGKYVLICNLPGHYKAGQFAAFRVG